MTKFLPTSPLNWFRHVLPWLLDIKLLNHQILVLLNDIHSDFHKMPSDSDLEYEIFIYKLVINTTGLLSLLSSVLATYLIFYHSIPDMKNYRIYLLNIVFWSCLSDIYLSLFYTPIFDFKTISTCTHGWLRYFDNLGFKQFQLVSNYMESSNYRRK
jgi:hypothetical protein